MQSQFLSLLQNKPRMMLIGQLTSLQPEITFIVHGVYEYAVILQHNLPLQGNLGVPLQIQWQPAEDAEKILTIKNAHHIKTYPQSMYGLQNTMQEKTVITINTGWVKLINNETVTFLLEIDTNSAV